MHTGKTANFKNEPKKKPSTKASLPNSFHYYTISLNYVHIKLWERPNRALYLNCNQDRLEGVKAINYPVQLFFVRWHHIWRWHRLQASVYAYVCISTCIAMYLKYDKKKLSRRRMKSTCSNPTCYIPYINLFCRPC